VEIVNTVIELFKLYFPSTLVIPTLGNNEFYPDYSVMPEDEYLPVYWNSWNYSLSNIIPHNPNIRSTFLEGGYYYVPLSNKLWMIVLNSVFYSKQDAKMSASKNDPAGQFKFLQDTLEVVVQMGGKAIIAQHIPQGASRDGKRLMSTDYEKALDKIVRQYSASIAAIMSGHVHRDVFRLYYQKDEITPAAAVLISGAITPQDETNPSFTYVAYNESGIMDWDKYYLNINTTSNWSLEYTFSQAYPGYGGLINADAINYIIKKFYSNHEWLLKYRRFSVSEHMEGLSHDENPCNDICLAEHIDHDTYKDCNKSKNC